ncbi:MAG: VWA domain-containing protein [Gammaproteobacteria bacterium]|nr:VWA domain-containing protein [Gammaproteobacteria bacterium]MDH5801713.1 VWA domain-containing protein [Gammaproteobacteria bacterium]
MELVQNFHFLRPWWLLALLPLGLLTWVSWKHKLFSHSWSAVCDQRLLPYILVGASSGHSRFPAYLAALTGLLVIIALAGPVWKELPQPLYRTQSSLVIALDLSASMDASDIKPSRIERAKLKILDMLGRSREGQTALVVYAQESFVVSPLTDDSKTIAALVTSLNTEIMPTQGSEPAKAVEKSIELLKQAGAQQGMILLITDGVGDANVSDMAAAVRFKGHSLSVLAIGTETGAPIAQKGRSYLKDANGEIVVAKLDEAPLQDLAVKAGGRYSRFVTTDRDIDYLLQPLEQSRHSANRVEQNKNQIKADRWQEEGPWIALLLLPLAALAFRRGWIAILVLAIAPLPNTGHAFEWQQLWISKDQQAMKLYQAEEYGKAAKLFDSMPWRAAAHYKAGNYNKALQLLDGVDSVEAIYNKGNALARLGKYEEAVAAYDQVLKKNSSHQDAHYNKQLLEQYLKKDPNQQNQEQEKQQQNQNQKQEQNQSQQQSGEQNGQQGQQQGEQQQSEQKGGSGSQQQDHAQSGSKDNPADDQDIREQAQRDAAKDGDPSQQQNMASRDGKDKHQKDEKGDQQALLADEKQGDKGDENKNENTSEQAATATMTETAQATQQWLRRIPDDPGGLLRRKFLYQSQRSRSQGDGSKPW